MQTKEKVDELFADVVAGARKILDADRATLWLHDSTTSPNELYTIIAEGIDPIRIDASKGIVGAR